MKKPAHLTLISIKTKFNMLGVSRAIGAVMVAATLMSVTSVNGQETTQAQRALKPALSVFAPYVGTWEIDTKWENDSSIWAKNEFSVGMNGNFFEARTWTRNEAGKEYQRYHTIWRYNGEKEKIESYGFTYDGTVSTVVSEIDDSGEGKPIIRSQWQTDPESPIIKQEVQMNDGENSYGWRVWTSPDGVEWTQIMDGIYNKTDP